MKRTILTAAIMLAGITAAAAADFKAQIKGLDGKPVSVSETDKTPVTLGSVATTALLAPGGPESPTPEEKGRRFFIALKIHDGKGDRLTVEELALVKRVIGQIYGPLVYGRAVELIDGPQGSEPTPGKGIPPGAPGNLVK